MSLKSFHIAFIVIAGLSAFLVGGWGITHTVEGQTPHSVLGVAFLLVGAALAVYGVWFLRKLKMKEMTS